MSENRFSCMPQGGRETVTIEASRILDSCKDRDCFERVRVFLTDFGNDIIEHTGSVRVKGAEIAWVCIGIDPVAFNRGFYTVTVRFYVKIIFEACLGIGRAQEFEGVAVVEKRVILYGSESNVSTFRSSNTSCDYCTPPLPAGSAKNAPTAVLETVDPVVLRAEVVEEHPPRKDCCCCCCQSCKEIPDAVTHRLSGQLCDGHPDGHVLLVSFGIFSILRIVRPAQYMIQATEYVIPDKECITATEEDPCAVFRSMSFPIREFSAPPCPDVMPSDKGGKCGC